MDILGLLYQNQWVVPYLKSVLILIAAFLVIGTIGRYLKKLLINSTLPADAQHILRSVVVYFLWFSVLMYITRELNLQEILVPLMGASFLIGAAVALAVKDVLSDAVAGVFIILDKHFDIGDEVETLNHRGEIVSVTLRKTRIRTGENTIVVMPNGKIDSSGWILYEKGLNK
ncbi:MAG: mechanosensitive ion channel [Methanosarcinales archaeon]|nr:mechanosensitive ion channel [Methanosarcinales archaeon]